MSSTPTVPPDGRRLSLTEELDDALGDPVVEEVPVVFLVGLSGRLAGKLFKIRSGESLIGRSSRAFMCLDEKAVSHKHARLMLGPDGCHLDDLDSTNGTFLNDVKVSSPQLLRAGDVVSVGNNAFGFLTDAEDDQQHTRAMARLTAPRHTSSAANLARLTSIPPPSTMGQIVPASPQVMPSLTTVAPSAGDLVAFPQEEQGNALDNALDKVELILGFAKRYWIVLVAGAVFGAGAGCAVGFLRPPGAIAEFEIYLRREATPDPTSQQREPSFALQGGEFFAFAERKFTDPTLVQGTLRHLHLPASMSDAAATAQNLAFSQVDRQGTFRGTFTNRDARFAEHLLTAHLQNFLEAEINKSLTVHASEVTLLRKEFEKNQNELRSVEEEMQKFKETHLQALPENAISQIQLKGALLAQRDQLLAAVTRYAAELKLAEHQLASEEAIVGTKVERSKPYETAIAQVRQQIAEAEAKGFAREHPELIKLRSEEQRLEALRSAAIGSETTDVDRQSNPEHKRLKDKVGELNVMLSASQQELQQVQGRLGEIEKISGKMPEVEADITRLSRDAAAAKDMHERLHMQLKSKELELQFERASVAARYEIMNAPHAFQPPRSAGMVRYTGMGLVGGFFLGIASALGHWLRKYARARRIRVTSPSSAK